MIAPFDAKELEDNLKKIKNVVYSKVQNKKQEEKKELLKTLQNILSNQ